MLINSVPPLGSIIPLFDNSALLSPRNRLRSFGLAHLKARQLECFQRGVVVGLFNNNTDFRDANLANWNLGELVVGLDGGCSEDRGKGTGGEALRCGGRESGEACGGEGKEGGELHCRDVILYEK